MFHQAVMVQSARPPHFTREARGPYSGGSAHLVYGGAFFALGTRGSAGRGR